ncbi:MAG: type VI secretion system tip protein VgrG [Alphaproteobacteria bacterium]|nr:type VI secretion system tip protein VgrG [Alphaproteobacteria bacterium]
MGNLKQGNVFLEITTTLGEDSCVLSEFHATEGISELFEGTAVFITENVNVDLSGMIGKPITVRMEFEAENEEQEEPKPTNPILSKSSNFFNQIKNKLGVAQSIPASRAVLVMPIVAPVLSFGMMDSIKGVFGKSGAAGGKSTTLGSGLSSKLKGGLSLGGLGDATNSMAAFSSKPMNAGAAAGPAPSGFFSKIKASITSRLGGDVEKGKIGELLTGLGGKLSGALGGDAGGKQGTGLGAKPGGGAAGGGITHTLLKGLSSRLGGDENSEPLGNILNGLGGKLIDKTRGNAFLTKLVDKVGGTEEAKKKLKVLIEKLNTGELSKKLAVFIEGDEENEGLINKAKNKILGYLGVKPKVESIGNVQAGPKEKEASQPAFGESGAVVNDLDERDLSKNIRYFNGIVGEISQGPTDRNESKITIYTVKFYPKLWLLKHSLNCRIFQNMTTLEIISTILKENDITDITDKTKDKGKEIREYCVQYNESNFDFISRLMEQEGLFYYFLHTEKSHILVLADAPEAHHQCPHTQKALMQEKPNGQSDFNCIQLAEIVSRVVPGEQALSDYNFELPSNKLFTTIKGKGLGGRIYSYPGSYTNKSAGDKISRSRLEAHELPKDMVYALSTIPYLEPGAFFNLKQHMRQDANKKYVVYQVMHHAVQDSEDGNFYNNKFSAFDYAGGPFRPPLKTNSPKIYGTQTARVTGKAGEEIWTDAYGRVKVKFHWDENKAEDETTSCWVRVAQGWAGSGWGMLFTPRIGQEVVVTFLDGDPDQPLITGSVYNGEMKAPYLPDQPTISTIKSNSTKDADGYNELRFQDLAENEEIYLHAQKDLNEDVINNHTETIERGIFKQDILTGDRFVNLKGRNAPRITKSVTSKNKEGLSVIQTLELQPEIPGTGNDTLVLDRGSLLQHLKGETILEKEEKDKKEGKSSDGEGGEKDKKPQVDNSKDRSGQGDLTTILSRGDRSLFLEKGDETRILKKGNRTIVVRGGDEIRSVSGDLKQTIGKNYILNIVGNLDINVTGDVKINGANITATTNPQAVQVPEYLIPPQVAMALERRDEEAKNKVEKKKSVFSVLSESLGLSSEKASEQEESEEHFNATTKKIATLSSVAGFVSKVAGSQAEKGGKYSQVFLAISQHGGALSEKLKTIAEDRKKGNKESSSSGIGAIAVKAIGMGEKLFAKKKDGESTSLAGQLKKLKAFKGFGGGAKNSKGGATGGAADQKSAFEKLSENKGGLAEKLKGIMSQRKKEGKPESKNESGTSSFMDGIKGLTEKKDGSSKLSNLSNISKKLKAFTGKKKKDGSKSGLADMLKGASRKKEKGGAGAASEGISGLLGGKEGDEKKGGLGNVVSGVFGNKDKEESSQSMGPKGAIKFISRTYDINADESITGVSMTVTTDAKVCNTMKGGTKAVVQGGALTNIQGGTVKID